MQLYEKVYGDAAEEALRQSNFIQTCLDNELHNSGDSTYKKGLNAMSDFTPEELNGKMSDSFSTPRQHHFGLNAHASFVHVR